MVDASTSSVQAASSRARTSGAAITRSFRRRSQDVVPGALSVVGDERAREAVRLAQVFRAAAAVDEPRGVVGPAEGAVPEVLGHLRADQAGGRGGAVATAHVVGAADVEVARAARRD